VARHLRAALMAGAYEPGSRLAITDIATQLGVSTMPVREALVALANEGLVDVLPHRGFRAAPLTRQDIEDVYMVHSMIAGSLAQRAAGAMSAAQITELRRLQAEIVRTARRSLSLPKKADQIETLNFDFHRIINQTTESRRARWFLRAATRFIPRQFYVEIPGWISASVEDHTQIVDALESGDGAAAHGLMKAHVEKAGKLVVARLSELGVLGTAAADEGSSRSAIHRP